MDYDVRYLGGVRFFNDGDFFEAHEAWEGLWLETSGPERRFYQGLIQAAVALYHFGNGNLRGAVKLYGSSLGYLGLGAQPPTSEWGVLIGDGKNFMTTAWWMSIFPGIAIFLTVLGFNLLGDGLRDALDPREH